MGRISENNPRYRTKDEMVRDVAIALNSGLSYGAKYAVLANVAWAWTEFDGKYKGCQRWTKKARQEFDTKNLRHEHAVPKRVVIDMLLKLVNPNENEVRRICDHFLLGVVVTIEEDRILNEHFRKVMPNEFAAGSSPDFENPWLRYLRCNIEFDAEKQNLV